MPSLLQPVHLRRLRPLQLRQRTLMPYVRYRNGKRLRMPHSSPAMAPSSTSLVGGGKGDREQNETVSTRIDSCNPNGRYVPVRSIVVRDSSQSNRGEWTLEAVTVRRCAVNACAPYQAPKFIRAVHFSRDSGRITTHISIPHSD